MVPREKWMYSSACVLSSLVPCGKRAKRLLNPFSSILAVMMELPLQRGQTGLCASHMSRQSLHPTRR